jgi:hypothetical protein
MTNQPHPDRPDGDGLHDQRCPTCRMSWWLFPPAKIHGEPRVRCVNCKDVFHEDVVRATPQQSGNSGEGLEEENPFIEDAKRWVTFSPPKPAPDAVREALIDLVWEEINALGGVPEQNNSYDQGCVDTVGKALEIVEKFGGTDPAPKRAIAAPVPSPDGAGEWQSVPTHPSDEQIISALEWSLEWMRAHNVVGLSPFKDYPPVKETIKGMYAAMLAAAPVPDPGLDKFKREVAERYAAGDGGGEAVAWRWRRPAHDLEWTHGMYRPSNPLLECEPLYATPPVRGERESLEAECLKAICSAGDRCSCADKNWQWRDHFCNVAMAHVRAILDRVSLPVQSGAGEREAAGQRIWDSQRARLTDQTCNAAKRPWRSKECPDAFWDGYVLDAAAALSRQPPQSTSEGAGMSDEAFLEDRPKPNFNQWIQSDDGGEQMPQATASVPHE